jgi:replicative DNA helicase
MTQFLELLDEIRTIKTTERGTAQVPLQIRQTLAGEKTSFKKSELPRVLPYITFKNIAVLFPFEITVEELLDRLVALIEAIKLNYLDLLRFKGTLSNEDVKRLSKVISNAREEERKYWKERISSTVFELLQSEADGP